MILGTVPGQASLAASQYYAHPRNAFWPIMYALIVQSPPSFDVHRSISYVARCNTLTEQGFAVWDVLQSCDRPGSLDSNINRHSEKPNDIASLLQQHPELRCIACNGRTAEKLFNRHIKDTLSVGSMGARNSRQSTGQPPVRLVSLPSTSPAMASLTLEQKYQVWADGLLG